MTAGGQVHLTESELSDLADGVLDVPTRTRLQAHLASCERCDAAMGDLRSLGAWAAGQRGGVTAPPELWTLVAASTIHLRTVRKQVLRSMRGPLLVAALALVAATAAVTWRLAHLTREPADPAEPPAAATAPVQRPLGPGQHAGHPTTERSPRRAPAPPAAPIPPEPEPRPRQ